MLSDATAVIDVETEELRVAAERNSIGEHATDLAAIVADHVAAPGFGTKRDGGKRETVTVTAGDWNQRAGVALGSGALAAQSIDRLREQSHLVDLESGHESTWQRVLKERVPAVRPLKADIQVELKCNLQNFDAIKDAVLCPSATRFPTGGWRSFDHIATAGVAEAPLGQRIAMQTKDGRTLQALLQQYWLSGNTMRKKEVSSKIQSLFTANETDASVRSDAVFIQCVERVLQRQSVEGDAVGEPVTKKQRVER